jgi:hypothetical protein
MGATFRTHEKDGKFVQDLIGKPEGNTWVHSNRKKNSVIEKWVMTMKGLLVDYFEQGSVPS